MELCLYILLTFEGGLIRSNSLILRPCNLEPPTLPFELPYFSQLPPYQIHFNLLQSKICLGHDENCWLQWTKKNAVVDIDHQCRRIELHCSTGRRQPTALFYWSKSTDCTFLLVDININNIG